MDVLKNIILPNIPQTYFSQKNEINYSALILNIIESQAKAFFSNHTKFLSEMKFLNPLKISMPEQNYDEIDIETVENFHNFVDQKIQQFTSSGSFQFIFKNKQTNIKNISKLIDENPTNVNLLIDSILISIFNSDLNLLIKTFETIFSFNLLQKEIKISKNIFGNLPVKFNQNYNQLQIDVDMDSKEDEIEYSNIEIKPNEFKTSTILAATPNYLVFKTFYRYGIAFNFVKINLYRYHSLQNNCITKLKFGEINTLHITTVGNDIFIYNSDNNTAYLYDTNNTSDFTITKLRKALFLSINPPFTSDGFYIYSIINYYNIGVFRINKEKNELVLDRMIQVKESKRLDPDYNQGVLCEKLVNKSSMVTNGITLQLIVTEKKENDKFVHFARVISLVSGNHIKDFRFEIPYHIFSICIEPISKVIWQLTVIKGRVKIIKYKYKGPEPPWLSKVNLPCFSNIPKINSFSQFCNLLFDFCNSTSFHFFGNENDLPKFFLAFIDTKLIDLILLFLSKRFKNVKFNQFLFVILSFQINQIKLSNKQADDLYVIIQYYILFPYYYDFLTLFLIHIANNCKSSDVSRFFGLLFQYLSTKTIDIDSFLLLILRLKKSKKFPFVFANNLPVVMYNLIDELYNNSISTIGNDFLISIQVSIFLNYSRILKSKPNKIEKIDTITLEYSTILISKCKKLINNYDSIEEFEKSPLIILLRKLLLDLNFPANFSPSSWNYLPLLIEFSKEFMISPLFNSRKDNMFYFTFINVIYLCICCFKKIVSISNIDHLKNHLIFFKNSTDDEKSISTIFDNKLNDGDFDNVINLMYSKVPNVLNKRLTQEDKEFEKIIFLSLIYKTQEIEDVISISNQIKRQEKVQISPLIKSIIQEIYKIRSFLRLKKQNSASDYASIFNNYNEKAHFVLKSSTEKLELKKIIEFFNEKNQIFELIDEKKQLESISQRFILSIKMINYFTAQSFPTEIVSLLVSRIFVNFDIFTIYELNFDTNKIDLDFSINIINSFIENIDDTSIDFVIPFVYNYLILLAKSFEPDKVHDIILRSAKTIIQILIEKSNKMNHKLLKICISLFCYFNRNLHDKKLFILEQDERENISQIILNNIDIKSSMSLGFNHSLFYGQITISQSLDHIKSILGYVNSNKFHQVSLILFDFLQSFSLNNNENDFMNLLSFLMDIIGSVLGGSQSKNLLQSSIEINEIENGETKTFIRVPKSQILCILEIIQIIRKLFINTEENSSQMIKKHFENIIENFKFDNPNEMKQIYAILAILTNKLFKFLRPNIFVKANDNETYFVLSIDEKNQKFEGVKIPVLNGKIIQKKIDFSKVISTHEPIELSKESKSNFTSILIILLKKIINIEETNSSISFLFYLFYQNIKENLKYLEKNDEFINLFFSLIEKKENKQFKFGNKYSQSLLTLLENSLNIQTEGVFSKNTINYQMHHVSYTNIVLKNDFELTRDKLQAKTSPHVFISSILNENKPMYFCVKYENNQQTFSFGIVTHSILKKSTTILYSSKNSQFMINGEKIADYKLEPNNSIECCYSPTNNIVYFADYSNQIFSCDLGMKSECSFIILVYPRTQINYNFDFVPQMNYFQNKQEDGKIMIKLNDFDPNKKIIKLSPTMKNIEYTDKEIDLKLLFLPYKFNFLTQTNTFLERYEKAFFISSHERICSSPIQSDNYIRIYSILGEFDFVNKDQILIENMNFIPSFNWNNYLFLPQEILNYYIKKACEYNEEEIFTFFATRIIDKTMDLSTAINNLFPSVSSVLNFIISILFLLDPINFSHLNEEKCPIDFVSCNSLEKCHKTDLYDYFTALKRILEQFQGNKKEQLINEWFIKLKNDFNNKFLHFCSQNNENLSIVKTLDSYQYFNEKDASGWIIFPYKFGCYNCPSTLVDEVVFPKSFEDNINYMYCTKKILKIHPVKNDLFPIGILPLFDKSNESLLDSFYHLAVSFKYFVLFSKDNLSNEMKHELWEMLFNSIMAGSPFFYSHSWELISFLNSQISFSEKQMTLLNQLNAFNNTIKQNSIQRFISMKSFDMNIKRAKEFEENLFDEHSTHNIQFPNNIIPNELNSLTHLESLIKVISRILVKDDSEEFPIHLVLTEWIDAFIHYPPCNITVVSPNVLKIEFIAFVPQYYFELNCKEKFYNNTNIFVSLSNDFDKYFLCCQLFNIKIKDIKSKIFYIKFPETEDISNYNFIVHNPFHLNQTLAFSSIILQYKTYLINDIKILCNEFTADEDKQILNLSCHSSYINQSISTRLREFVLKKLGKTRHPIHLIYLRGIYLITINYIFINEKTIMQHEEKEKLKKFLDINLFTICFLNCIDLNSSNGSETIRINRQDALSYRKGITKDEKNSIIAQFSRSYLANPSHFRSSNSPFQIRYINESGIDAGGLSRDFITEFVRDINAPEIGLFIQTPNGRNREGSYQECIIPNPSPSIKNSSDYYHVIGAFLALIIRMNTKQIDLHFPPLFWEFIVDGKLTIDSIYSIDNSYQKMSSHLLDCSLISSFSLLNMRGMKIKIDQFDMITKSNCEEYVERCNEFRLNELKVPLSKIRDGFWENLNFSPPAFTTASLLESLVCNEKVLTIDSLKKAITFNDVDELQKGFFWEVVSRMNNDDLKKLMHFWTGLTSLNSNELKIAAYICNTDSHLPSASTCFFTLNLPPFSSADKMYTAFMTAINEATTFEKA